jgi:hypothetical protein
MFYVLVDTCSPVADSPRAIDYEAGLLACPVLFQPARHGECHPRYQRPKHLALLRVLQTVVIDQRHLHRYGTGS